MDSVRVVGAVNFRDLGGIPLANGGATQTGVAYRSSELSRLRDSDLDALEMSDIGLIVDLRTEEEQQLYPSRVYEFEHIDTIRLPMQKILISEHMPEIYERIVSGASPAEVGPLVAAMLANAKPARDLYLAMLQHSASSLVALAKHIANPVNGERPAVIFHCTAGRDRTGVCAAVLLDAVGALREAIVSDYLQSGERLHGSWQDRMHAQLRDFDVEITEAVEAATSGVSASAMEGMLDWLDSVGGSGAYLCANGLSDEELRQLRARLVA